MKKLAIVIVSLGALAGCAAPGPYYNNQTYARPADPSQWRVVSVTPVPIGTGARVTASGQSTTTSTPVPATTYSDSTYSTPYYSTQQPVYVQQQPVYVQQPVYAPQPIYVEQPNYWYPPISIGLGFDFGRSSWRGHRGGRGGWGGHIGTHFPYRR